MKLEQVLRKWLKEKGDPKYERHTKELLDLLSNQKNYNMIFKSQKVFLKGKWNFELKYDDKDGYQVIIEANKFPTKEEAQEKMAIAREHFETQWKK